MRYRHHLPVRARAAVLAAVVLVVLPACGTSTPPPSSRLHARPSPAGYALIPGEVAIYVAGLPTRIVANGRSFVVRLVVVDGLGHSFAIPGACNGWLDAGLTSPAIPFESFDGGVACPAQAIGPGETQVSRTVITTYPQCSQEPTQSDPAGPRCTGPEHNQPPVLPPGRYRLSVDTTWFPHAHVEGLVGVMLVRG